MVIFHSYDSLPEGNLLLFFGAQTAPKERRTAEAMAQRVNEALTRQSRVLVADIGRPNRKAPGLPGGRTAWCLGNPWETLWVIHGYPSISNMLDEL